MITLDGLDSIEKVLPYKGFRIFINKEDSDVFLIEFLIGYKVYNNGVYIGEVRNIRGVNMILLL